MEYFLKYSIDESVQTNIFSKFQKGKDFLQRNFAKSRFKEHNLPTVFL